MAQIFHPSTNTLAKASIFGAVFIIGGALWLLAELTRSPYATQADVVRAQPVPFSHEHHVSGLGIDCRFCHTSVETSSSAGMPNTKTCMTCHSQIWTNAEMLEPVRRSWREDKPIEWNRVHDMPDFVQFNHSVHVAKGVSCVSCHGQIDQMPLVRQVASLQMEWCLKCHRNPEEHLRPRDQVFNMKWPLDRDALVATSSAADDWPEQLSVSNDDPWNQATHGQMLVEKYGVRKEQITNCSICHY